MEGEASIYQVEDHFSVAGEDRRDHSDYKLALAYRVLVQVEISSLGCHVSMTVLLAPIIPRPVLAVPLVLTWLARPGSSALATTRVHE